MAEIVQFWKPIVLPGDISYHSFLLLEDENGNYTAIARGGPQSADVGFPAGSVSDGSLPFGDILTSVQPYTYSMTGPAAKDYFPSDALSQLPQETVITGPYDLLSNEFYNLQGVSQSINNAAIPYAVTVMGWTAPRSGIDVP